MFKKSSATLQATLRTALVAVVLTAAGAAGAAPVGELYPADQQSQAAAVKTRAQVIEELIQARAAGQVATGEVGYAFGTPTERNAIAGKSRADVRADAVRSARNSAPVGNTFGGN